MTGYFRKCEKILEVAGLFCLKEARSNILFYLASELAPSELFFVGKLLP